MKQFKAFLKQRKPQPDSESESEDLFRKHKKSQLTKFKLRDAAKAYTDLTPNVFPTYLHKNQSFPNEHLLRRYVIEHPLTARNPEMRWMFYWRHFNSQLGDICAGTCKYAGCGARLYAHPTVNDLNQRVVTAIYALHTHDIFAYVDQGNQNGRKNLKGSKQEKDQDNSRSKVDGKLTDYRVYSYLYDFLKEKKLDVLVSKDYKFDTIFYPNVTVAASQSMKQCYEQYGDILNFDFYEGLLNNRTGDGRIHTVVTFTVVDTNMRALIVGFGIIMDIVAENFTQALQLLFELNNGRRPQTLFMYRNVEDIRAVQLMATKNIYTGVVVYYLEDILEQLAEALPGDENRVRFGAETFKTLATTNSKLEYATCLELLLLDTKNERIYDDLISSSSSLCLLDIPKVLIGPRENNDAHKMENYIWEKIGVRACFDVVKMLLFLHTTELRQSKRKTFFEEEIEEVFKDPRLKAVRQCFQVRIFNQFLENYISGLIDFTSEKMEAGSYKVRNRKSGEELKVQLNECQCSESMKTGIPCAHLLSCVRQTEQSYVRLFDPRWRVSQA